MQKCFVPYTNQLVNSQTVILIDTFRRFHEDGLWKSHLIILTEGWILCYLDESKNQIERIFQLDFDAKFGTIKNQSGEIIGLKFERQGNYETFEIYSAEKYIIRGWELELEKRINKRGFHEEFRPLKKIGKGNFASVYLASRVFDHRKVAVKAFSKELLNGQQKGVQSIKNQIKLLRDVDHPNVIKLLSVYQSKNSLYLVMEFLQGQLLQTVFNKYIFNIVQTRTIMRGLIQAVAALSSKNIVHRDIKPQNIMFKSKNINDGVVVVDFGLATNCDEPQYIYTRCGTPGYVSPQIVNITDTKNTRCSPISDVFSLGVIFHILLMKRSPFKGKTFNEVLHQNRICKIDLNGDQYKFINRSAFDLLRKMLQKQPSKRITAQQALNHHFFQQNQNNNPERFEHSINKNKSIQMKRSPSLGIRQIRKSPSFVMKDRIQVFNLC